MESRFLILIFYEQSQTIGSVTYKSSLFRIKVLFPVLKTVGLGFKEKNTELWFRYAAGPFGFNFTMFTLEPLRKRKMSKGAGSRGLMIHGKVGSDVPVWVIHPSTVMAANWVACPELRALVPCFKSLLISVYTNIPACELQHLRALIHDLCQT